MTLDQAGRATGWTRLEPPSPPLAPWVEHSFRTVYPAGLCTGMGWKIVPDASPHLIVSRRGGVTRAVLVGPRSRAVERPHGGRAWTVGVRFRPGALAALTEGPASELRNGGLPLKGVFGRKSRELQERLGEAATAGEAERLLLVALVGRLQDARPVDWRVRWLVDPERRDAVSAPLRRLARQRGLSPRTLREVVSRTVGLTPKTVLRIRRLHHAAGMGLARPRLPWSRVAPAVGYYDQPHLNRDFVALMGESPGVYRDRRNRSGRRSLQAGHPVGE